jgi:two-component system NtrC family sensor kinase
MKYLAYMLLMVLQFKVTVNAGSDSICDYNSINNNIVMDNEYSLPKSLKTSNDAMIMIKLIRNEFKEIVYLIDMPMLLKSLKNGKKQIELAYDLVDLSEKVVYVEGIIKAYSMIGYYNFQSGQYDKAINFYKKSLERCNNINNATLHTFILQNLAIIYYDIGNFKQSIVHCSKTLEIGMKCKDKKIILSALNCLSNNYIALCDYEKALEFSFDAIEISKELKDNQTLAIIYQNIGTIYSEIKNYERSLKYNLESLKINEELGNKINIALSLSSIGMIYCQTNNYFQALDYLNKSLKLNQEIMFNQGLANVYDNLGCVHKNLGNKSLALDYYKKSLNITLQLNDHWNIANITNHIGQIYIMGKEYKKAKRFLRQSEYYAKGIKATDLLQDCYKSFTELYENMGSFKKAYRYLKLYTDYNDSTIVKNSNKISDILMKYESKKRDKENELILRRNTVELDKQKSISGQLFFGISALLLLLSLSYLRYREKNKQNIHLSQKVVESLEKQIQQKQIILHQASLTTLGEYSAAIAHEINQPLQLMYFDIESLSLLLKEQNINYSKVNQMIESLKDNMNRIKFIIGYVKNFSCRQKEYIKENFDLNTMVKNTMWIIQRHYEKLGIKIKLIFDEPNNIIYGSLFKLEQAFLNILSNARDAIEEKCLQNLDGDCQCITIKCSIEYDYAILSVEDKGIGIKPEIKDLIFNPFFTTKNFGKGIGLGLSVVKEVIEDMNGQIEIESTYLEGTNIKLKIPVPKE